MKHLGYNPLNVIPRDITAKKVVFDVGDHYKPSVKSTSFLYSTDPLPMKNVEAYMRASNGFQDLTGQKKGYFTVLGLFDTHGYNKWVVRCSCGNQEMRRATSWHKITDQVDQNRCQSCLDLERIRSRDFFQKHGYYPWQEPHKRRTRRQLQEEST